MELYNSVYFTTIHTTCLCVYRLQEGQHILSQRIAYLKEKLSDLESSPSAAVSGVHFNIASCYHLLNSDFDHTCSALEHAQKALELSERDGEIEWLIEQLVRQKDAEEKKVEKEKSLLCMGYDSSTLSMPKPVQVQSCTCMLCDPCNQVQF